LSTKKETQYDRCAHWFWQTEAEAHLWTPEIYESYTAPITVTRIIPANPIDKFNPGMDDLAWKWWAIAQQYLHFDFVVIARLRELGGKWKKPIVFHASRPAEVRTKKDFGYPIKRDRVTFCLSACPAKINWPERRTIQRQKEAKKEVRSPKFLINRKK
jgi:hypothetical protein